MQLLNESAPAVHVVMNIFGDFLAVEASLHVSHAVVLLTVASRPGITITELAKAARMSAAGASRNARKLMDASGGKDDGLGLISVDRAADARLRPLRLTKRGRDLLNAAIDRLPKSPEDASVVAPH